MVMKRMFKLHMGNAGLDKLTDSSLESQGEQKVEKS